MDNKNIIVNKAGIRLNPEQCYFKTQIDEFGKVEIPIELRKILKLNQKNIIILNKLDDKIILEKYKRPSF